MCGGQRRTGLASPYQLLTRTNESLQESQVRQAEDRKRVKDVPGKVRKQVEEFEEEVVRGGARAGNHRTTRAALWTPAAGCAQPGTNKSKDSETHLI